ncbi:MAG: S8 family peptidase [Bacteroidales bacterium]|nr:S8 family peptidase [Bacteroidales bacterium]
MKIKIILFVIFIITATATSFSQSLRRAETEAGVDSVWQGINLPQGYTGKDVIIGITDWGFDYTHPVFFDTTLTHSRIIGVWDMFRSQGPHPAGYNYGTEYTDTADILAAMSDTSNVYQYGYHGTHVASIAGGSGGGSKYRGIAFEADLLFATFLVNEQAVIDAFNWMYQIARTKGKRLVINMSWGLYYMDNLDGTGRLAHTIDSLTDLGVVFVTSAGNNGNVNFHLGQNFSQKQDTLRSQITFYSGHHDSLWGQSISMTNSPYTSFQFAIQYLNTENAVTGTTPFYATSDNCDIDTFAIFNGDTIIYNLTTESANTDNHRPQARLRIQNGNYSGKICLLVSASAGEFHAWNVAELTNDVGNWGNDFIQPVKDSSWTAGDTRYGLGAPANIKNVITVAAHRSSKMVNNTLTGGEIASFSSYGSTIDGRLKPEISAPGVSVIAALSSFTTTFSGNVNTTVNFRNKQYGFAELSGTSMSSPFVTGVVALMLQANPKLSPAEIKSILASTAKQDKFTQTSGQERFGYGKTDAYQAVKKALETNHIATPQKPCWHAYPNPCRQAFVITNNSDRPLHITIYNMEGQTLHTLIVDGNAEQIDTSNWSKGIYLLKSEDGNTIKIVKQ